MIRYELKDSVKQDAFEKILPGFGDALQAACDEQFDDEFSHVCVQLNHGGGVLWDGGVNIKKSAICTKEVYDPRAWNNYPEVTPPEGVVMRLEITEAPFDKGLEGHKACATWLVRTFEILDDDRKTKINTTEGRWYIVWRDSEPDEMLETYGFTPEEKIFKARFRPWDEESAK